MEKKNARVRVKLDAVESIERFSFRERIEHGIDSTRAKLFSALPAFQVNMFPERIGELKGTETAGKLGMVRTAPARKVEIKENRGALAFNSEIAPEFRKNKKRN